MSSDARYDGESLSSARATASSEARRAIARLSDESCASQGRGGESGDYALSFFLDLLIKDAEENPSKLVAYTEEMAAEDDELLAGVVIDS